MRIFVIVLIITLGITFDMFSKVFVEDTIFGAWKDICLQPESNSAATSAYCDRNTLDIYPLLGIQLSYNDGIAFSLPIRGIGLQILTLLLICAIVYYYLHDEYPKRSKLLDTGYALILAGALSHGYERIFIGHVVDFIAVKYFAILNFADIFISIGACCIFCYYILYDKHNSR